MAEVLRRLGGYEHYYNLRKRKRRQDDQETFEATVEAVVCDMIVAHLEGEVRGTAIPLSNSVLGERSRYRSRAFNKMLPSILQMMAAPELEFIRLEKGRQGDLLRRGQRTLIWPTKRLAAQISQHGVKDGDIGRSAFAETIILKAEKHGFWDDGRYLDYEDDDQTRRFRAELAEINRWIADAEIVVETRCLKMPRKVLTHKRQMQRVFTRGSFKSGGRLFSGFWQELDRTDRLKALRISGEQVVELDYGQMGPRILYGLKGIDPGSRDLYDIPGISPGYREGVKKLFNAITFAMKPLERKPQGTKVLLPRTSVHDLCKLIADAHPAISDLFYKGAGHDAQFIESEITVQLLLALKREDIVGLQIHDSILVPASTAGFVQMKMEALAEQVAGVPIPVTVSPMGT